MTSHEELTKALSSNEPDYAAILSTVREEDLPDLAALAAAEDVLLASKAVYLAGMTGLGGAASILTTAASSPHPELRVAAAHCCRHLPGPAVLSPLRALLADGDAGVQFQAVASTALLDLRGLRDEMEQVASDQAGNYVGDAATAVLEDWQ
ncbi:MAG: HEAT repeat domain-containing protein [Planctomycetes bacterium]|nr:HEAT repeat domain-containing protein [Planctomycetota bacterium]